MEGVNENIYCSFLCTQCLCERLYTPYLTAQPIKQKLLLLEQVLLKKWKKPQKNPLDYYSCQFVPGKTHAFRYRNRYQPPKKKKKSTSWNTYLWGPSSPALPTPLVFQQEPNDTLWCWRFKGTCSEGDLVQLSQISGPTFSGPRSDCSFCSQPHQEDFFITASLFPATMLGSLFFLISDDVVFVILAIIRVPTGAKMKLDRFN